MFTIPAQTPQENALNYATAVFLINDKARALRGTYEAGENAPRALFKTFDATIKKDDLVIVPTNTRHNMTVVKIVEVDVEIEIETDSPVWIVGKVDPSPYNALLGAEQEAISAIRSAEKTRKREELKKALLADTEAKISGMPIAALGHDTALPAE